MSELGSSDELKAIAKQYIESFWKADIHRDFDDLIKFVDGEKRQVPRAQEEVEQIYLQIEHYASFLAEELVERWNDAGIYSSSDIRRDPNTQAEHIKICTTTFSRYIAKVETYVRGQRSSKG